MKVLVIGSGGREHALALKISESPLVSQVYCAPGNAGTCKFAINVPIHANDIPNLGRFAKRERIDLTVVGPEKPLTDGIVDMFEFNDLKIFGPNMLAAALEGSKVLMKELLREYGIPTAKFKYFYNPDLAYEYAKEQSFPLVIKADGLAAGKGVYICENLNESFKAIQEIMVERKFEDAGNRIVIEEFLKGEEASCMYFVDKNMHILSLPSSQDHKRVGNSDTGPNTGGMGAYSPAPVITDAVEKKILKDIIYPTVKAMAAEGRPYTGALYAGLMIDAGNPKVLEFNARLGDPETQPLMMRMKSDIVPILLAALDGKLNECEIKWDERPAVCVVMAAKGYPESYEKGFPIEGIFNEEKIGARVYHAGTVLDEAGKLVSSGGRVLGVTALGETFIEAQQSAYYAVGKIESDGNLFYRGDIANRAIYR